MWSTNTNYERFLLLFVGVKSYLVWQDKNNTHGLMKFILFLAFDWIIYLVLILLIDYSIMSKIKNAIMGLSLIHI